VAVEVLGQQRQQFLEILVVLVVEVFKVDLVGQELQVKEMLVEVVVLQHLLMVEVVVAVQTPLEQMVLLH